MMKIKELPPQEELQKLFYYDNRLKWRVDRRVGILNIKANDNVVGNVLNSGRAQIMVFGENYLLSRIVYQVVHGNLTTDLVIDHINRNRLDDRIENLRATTQKHNNRNRKMQSSNTTGFTGVHMKTYRRFKLDGSYTEWYYYIAKWSDAEGHIRTKRFSIHSLGKEKAFELACNYRKAMIQALKDSGEWYDDNHGI